VGGDELRSHDKAAGLRSVFSAVAHVRQCRVKLEDDVSFLPMRMLLGARHRDPTRLEIRLGENAAQYSATQTKPECLEGWQMLRIVLTYCATVSDLF
jgi:hypothetical protein